MKKMYLKELCLAFIMLISTQMKAADIEVVMAGVGGNTSGQMVARLQTSVLDEKPDVVLILAGTNDVLHVKKLTTIEDFEDNINHIVDQIQAINSDIVIMTIPPCNEELWLSDKTDEQKAYYAPEGPNGRIDMFNEVLKKIASDNKLPLIDLNAAFGTNYSLLSSRVGDAVHPTTEGYNMMADKIYNALVEEKLAKGKIVCLGNSITTHYPEFLEDRLLGKVSVQTVTKYKLVSVNYVNLSDDAVVTAQPIISEKLDIHASEKSENAIEVKLNEIIHPNLSGIGGAFNEQGADAYMSLSKKDQKLLAKNLFNTKRGIGFSMCRTALGSSDFGLSAYSYSETAEDYNMEHFSVARDQKAILPFINAAQTQNSELKIFASPWSPPAWMKYTGKMDAGDKDKEHNKLKEEAKIYDAYALYFTKYVQQYANNGVDISRLVIQNETDMNPSYPGCDMSPEQMAELAFDYIRPAFKTAALETKIWAGSFRGKRGDAEKFLTLKNAESIDGIGLQYCGGRQVKALSVNYQNMSFMHTEGKCYHGENSMEQARARFSEICMWLNGGCENYCYWNMILNEGSTSAWGWKQNSMIQIDRQAKTVTYNADYAPLALLSTFVHPGDQSISTITPKKVNALTVRNAKQLVVFLQNDTDVASTQNIQLVDDNYTVQLPAKSLCAFVFEPQK